MNRANSNVKDDLRSNEQRDALLHVEQFEPLLLRRRRQQTTINTMQMRLPTSPKMIQRLGMIESFFSTSEMRICSTTIDFIVRRFFLFYL